MNKYLIITNKREVEWEGKTGAIAREDFWQKEILTKKNADPGYDEKIKTTRLIRKKVRQLTIFDDPTYQE